MTTSDEFIALVLPYVRQAGAALDWWPSVILAQWADETDWGNSPAWINRKNPAGIDITSSSVAGPDFPTYEAATLAYIEFAKGSNYRPVTAAFPRGAQNQAIALGNSPWSAARYNNGGGPGSSLLAFMADYGLQRYDEATPAPAPVDPTPNPPTPPAYLEAENVQAYDPKSGGYWILDPRDGHVEAYDGAPYAGGLNDPPNRFGWEQIGPIAGFSAAEVDGDVGYVVSVMRSVPVQGEWFATYAFPRDGSLITAGKLGKGDAVRPDNLKDLKDYASAGLDTPPEWVNYFEAILSKLNIDGNQKYGDCTIAAIANAVPVWNHEVQGAVPVPTPNVAVKQYFLLEGSPNGEPNPSLDNGLVLADVLKAAKTDGLFGGTLQVPYYAPVTPSDLLQVKQAVAFYGLLYSGFQLPQSAMDQFNANEPFTVVPGSPIEGGHCMVVMGYNTKGPLLYTWQRVVQASWAFWEKYADEAWALIPHEFVRAGRGPLKTEDLAVLEADLQAA